MNVKEAQSHIHEINDEVYVGVGDFANHADSMFCIDGWVNTEQLRKIADIIDQIERKP